jgi:hypothetical protein
MPKLRSAHAIVLTALVLAPSCTSLKPRDDTDDERDNPIKEVARKAEPVYLIARDRSECVVPKERFRRVHIGERVACSWYFPR